MKFTIPRSVSRILATIFFSFIITGCYIESDLTLTSDDELQLNQMVLSIDAGSAVVEASVRHALSLLGIRDNFSLQELRTGQVSMDDYLLLKPTTPMLVPHSSTSGDTISIVPDGKLKKFEWSLEKRAQVFANKIGKSDTSSLNQVFLVVRIEFPGTVEMANTSEVDGNVYTWRITQGQLNKPFKISAIFHSDEKKREGSSQNKLTPRIDDFKASEKNNETPKDALVETTLRNEVLAWQPIVAASVFTLGACEGVLETSQQILSKDKRSRDIRPYASLGCNP